MPTIAETPFASLPAFAISIRQPYAWLICAGFKPVENRTWRTHYRGPVAIHAGSRPYPGFQDVCDEIRQRFKIELPEELPLGGIVGTATITDCVTTHKSKWFSGPFGFVMANAAHAPFVEMPGALGIFRIAA